MGSLSRIEDSSKRAPAVSVIIPAYRATRFVGAAIDSVLNQSFTDYELIIINDGSPDTGELEAILQSYSDSLIYLKQDNRGPAAARNTGLRIARGRLVAFLDSDDYWLPDFLAEQVGFLDSNSSFDLVYSDARFIGDSPLAGRTFMQMTPSAGEVSFESLADERCTVILSGVVARKQAVLDVGMFNERFRYAEDFDLWLRLTRRGCRLGYQKKVLLAKREHPDRLCANVTTLFENALYVLDEADRTLAITESERRALDARKQKLIAIINLERGKRKLRDCEFAAAARLISEANRFYHSWKLRGVLISLKIWPRMLLRLYSRRSGLGQTEKGVTTRVAYD